MKAFTVCKILTPVLCRGKRSRKCYFPQAVQNGNGEVGCNRFTGDYFGYFELQCATCGYCNQITMDVKVVGRYWFFNLLFTVSPNPSTTTYI